MRAHTSTPVLLLASATIACLLVACHACDPDQMHHGCKIYGAQCSCGHGCNTEFIYRSRTECLNAIKERNSNICYRVPCLRGICIQTMQDPGYSCKCEGTGFYGRRCEKACPTIPMRGLVFPHECVVI
ncbi:hypothetical protein O0L34_g2795 [Tuta absoluta]|nr:hypothetical protein O0L34_g2795 [Tuta absoluta]